MNAEEKFAEIGIVIPVIPESCVSIERIRSLENQITTEFMKMIQYFRDCCDMPESIIQRTLEDFDAREAMKLTEVISDEELWNKLQIKWLKLNKRYFTLQSDLASTGCDEYDMNYMLQSELYQFFHEDMDKRRQRLEAPILKKLEQTEKEITDIDARQEELTHYKPGSNKEEISTIFLELFTNVLSKMQR